MTDLQHFSAHWRLLGQSEHALRNYISILRRLDQHTALADATPLDLRAWLAEQEVGDATRAYQIRAIRAFYRWRSEALECEDPSRTLKLPKVAEPVVRAVTLEQYTRLLASIPTTGFVNVRDRSIIAVLWSSGAPAEVAAIQTAHLDLMDGTFMIPQSKVAVLVRSVSPPRLRRRYGISQPSVSRSFKRYEARLARQQLAAG